MNARSLILAARPQLIAFLFTICLGISREIVCFLQPPTFLPAVGFGPDPLRTPPLEPFVFRDPRLGQLR